MQVKGSVAVIIGAAQGIGKAIVDKLLRLGAQVGIGRLRSSSLATGAVASSPYSR